MTRTDDADTDAIFAAFYAARDAAPQDRALLKQWTDRYPDLAGALMTADLARLSAPRSFAARLAEDSPPYPAAAETARRVLAARRLPPMTSLVGEASARGLDITSFASALRLDRLLLKRLEERQIEAATLPRSLVTRLSELLVRSAEDIAAYLRGAPALASAGHYRARKAPALSQSASRMSFADALEAGQSLSAEDKAYWRGEADAGVLGE